MAATFGCDDGQALPFELLVTMVQRLVRGANLPLSVDLEAGYADAVEDIATNIRRLASLGVVGINLEDSRVHRGQRQLEPMEIFPERIGALRHLLRDSNTTIFINVRTDPFLLDHSEARADSIRRGRCYREVGADGHFIPGIVAQEDVIAVGQAVPLPLNVMGVPGMPGFAQLSDGMLREHGLSPAPLRRWFLRHHGMTFQAY